MLPVKILRIALPTPLRRLFDYLAPQDIDTKMLIPGVRIQVPFGSRNIIGYFIEIAQNSTVPTAKLKPIITILDEKPLFTPELFQLCQWAADYYHHALGEVLAGALPEALRKGKSAPVVTIPINPVQTEACLELNAAQQMAVKMVCADLQNFQTYLLDGVTGSGKTEVYLQVIAKVLAAKQQVLVLVPEISLTPQTIARFRARFTVAIVALHSNLTAKERLHAWLAARDGIANIVIGTRSAIFTPFSSLGLIIVDEEHDQSFKQQDRFRYHGRDLAIMRASKLKIPIVLGSATPSLESLLNAQRKRYTYLTLPERAGNANLPAYQLIDIRHEHLTDGLSAALIENMREHLAQNNQVILFLNRRGFAPILFCAQCAWIAGCKRCSTRMVYHRMPPQLQCHHCEAKQMIPKHCEQCSAAQLQTIGLGTQRIEQTLAALFPEINIVRIDKDNTKRKGSMQSLLDNIHTQNKAILLGTQMLAKGHHFPHVTLAAIVDADNGLFSADFRAIEQLGQLFLQVAGRAGRAEKSGTVIVQTRQPEHPLLQLLLQEGYQAFAQHLLNERESAALPPYSHFAVFKAEAYKEDSTNKFLTEVKQMTMNHQAIDIYGPVTPALAKRKGLHTKYLLFKATQRHVLQLAIKNLLQKLEQYPAKHAVKWVIDIDPVEVM